MSPDALYPPALAPTAIRVLVSRATVRQRFEDRFTARRMAEDYLEIYRSLAGEDRSVLRAIREA